MGDEVIPESNGREGGNGGKDRAHGGERGGKVEKGGGRGCRRRDRKEGKGGIQFNFLRNSLVFEIQPPKGCARG